MKCKNCKTKMKSQKNVLIHKGLLKLKNREEFFPNTTDETPDFRKNVFECPNCGRIEIAGQTPHDVKNNVK